MVGIFLLILSRISIFINMSFPFLNKIFPFQAFAKIPKFLEEFLGNQERMILILWSRWNLKPFSIENFRPKIVQENFKNQLGGISGPPWSWFWTGEVSDSFFRPCNRILTNLGVLYQFHAKIAQKNLNILYFGSVVEHGTAWNVVRILFQFQQ